MTLPAPDYARNMRLIGHSDQGGRPDALQVMVNRGFAYVAHPWSQGFSIIDVRDVVALHLAALNDPETSGQRYLATAEYVPFPEVGNILRAAHPEWGVTTKTVPDWIIRLIASFGGPARQIINDIGNEKVFDGSKGQRLLGRPYIPARQSIVDTAEAAMRLGLLRPGEKVNLT